jgi:putative membrane protein
MATTASRSPRAIAPDDPKLVIEPAPSFDLPPLATAEAALPVPKVPDFAERRRSFRWGGLFLTALGGLVSLAAGAWMADLALGLLARQDWLGWLALGLIGVAGVALLMLILREAWALARLSRLGQTRRLADSAINHGDKGQAEASVANLKRLVGTRADLAWRRARFAEHEHDVMDAAELLRLAERELVTPLDGPARALIAAAARRVSVLTAVSPVALIDMAVVASLNMRMLRQLATLYGARPGTLGLIRLARLVVTHIVLTGGVAVGDDLVQQVIGHGLTARLSARLGEGLFNGALTARIGIAAMDVCRPLPYIEAPRPRFRDMVAQVARMVAVKGS